MSQLLQLKPGQAIKIQAIGANVAQSDADAEDYLLHFEGYDRRGLFIMIRKRVLLELFGHIEKHIAAVAESQGEK